MRVPKVESLRRFAVVITIVLVATAGALAEEPQTLPSPGSLGPRIDAYDPDVMVPLGVTAGACETLVEEGWNLVHSSDLTTPRRLEGEVVAGHVPHGDFYFNHDTEDHNFFVVPDNQNPRASFPTADYRHLLGYGNFHLGEDKERGRIEVEWEYGAHTWNEAAGNGYYGFPSWAWPNIGDRVFLEGFWIADCGHEVDLGPRTEFRTEIHPPWMVVTFRNTMQSPMARGQDRKGWVAPLGPDDRDFSPVNRADVFISSFGGEAVDNIFDDDDFLGRRDWWQPVNSKDYDFEIIAPERPSPDAQLVWRILDPPSDYIAPPGAVGPAFGDANLASYTRADGRTAVRVHIPFSSVPDADYLLFAKTILVGWDVPEAGVAHLRVTLERWHVYDDLEAEIGFDTEAEYSAWAHSGDRSIFVPVSDGGEDDECSDYVCDTEGNYEPVCEVDTNESNCAIGAFDRFLRPDDTLVISFRAKESDFPDESDDAGFADQAFTPAEGWGVGTHSLLQSDLTWSGEHRDAFNDIISEKNTCDGPGGACYAVGYRIDRIFDPTAMTISVPPIQYAQDANLFGARVVTPGASEKPRRRLPIELTFSGAGGVQELPGRTGDDGWSVPSDLITLPAGTYGLSAEFAGNGLLLGSAAAATATVTKDFTATELDLPAELRWGHRDAFRARLIETNVGQAEPPLPVPGKGMRVTLAGLLGTMTFTAGPTDAGGAVTFEPLMTLAPGRYEATACFAEDPWYVGSCSAPQTIRVTAGFSGYAHGGPITIAGASQTSLGDLHSESSIGLAGNRHRLSAGSSERLEYVTAFSDGSVGSTYNLFQVPPLGISPSFERSTYCGGASSLMGVPVTYIDGSWTIRNDAVLSGIYCVNGAIKIQSRVSGVATLLATGTVTTAGGHQSLTTADPTGADLLVLAESTAVKAIVLDPRAGQFTGAIVAAGGLEISSNDSTVRGALVARTITVKGANNTLDGR